MSFVRQDIIEFNRTKEPGPAKEYVVEAYLGKIHTAQVTLPRNALGDYAGVLNEKGQELLNGVKEKVEQGSFTNTLRNFCFAGGASGRFYDAAGMWTDAFANLYVQGTRIEKNKITGEIESTEIVETSVVLLYSDAWIYTRSGSLYKLESNAKTTPELSDNKID